MNSKHKTLKGGLDMLQLNNLRKEYVTGELRQAALDGVSISFRDSEFVSVLGPSGSGKTTMLNMIGGLDRYDSGDLIINGVSTAKYSDKDWDSYRNHSIGFIFQSYNLIAHQTVLENVELALTISGISASEKKKRSIEALEKVGLGNQLHKRPNQMSGGQLQRVAIARALVNEPDIILADEPTGALDSDTGIQVMDLLAEVAKDKLVIMVTHNPELAEQYSTRIVRLKDGKIIDDSMPFDPETEQEAEHKNLGRASMSRRTALSLSFSNLRTKKARTLLTAFAGSIGIIGIAMILALSNGVHKYIADVQRETMTSYPITIEKRTFDYSAIVSDSTGIKKKSDKDRERMHGNDAVYANISEFDRRADRKNVIKKNNLTDFKKYLDDPNSEIHKYIGTNGIAYIYDTKFDIYTHDSEGTLVNINGSTLRSGVKDANSSDAGTSMVSPEVDQLLPGADGKAVSEAYNNRYELVYGRYPETKEEIVLVTDEHNEIRAISLYRLGLLPSSEYSTIMKAVNEGEHKLPEKLKLSYEEICNKEFNLVAACDYFQKNNDGYYSSIYEDNQKVNRLINESLKLKIVGVLRKNKDSDVALINGTIGYTYLLTEWLMQHTEQSEVVKAQLADQNFNILEGVNFEAKNDEEKMRDAVTYIQNLTVTAKANLFTSLTRDFNVSDLTALMNGMGGEKTDIESFFDVDETEKSKMLDEMITSDTAKDMLLEVYNTYVSTGSFQENLETLGVVKEDEPDAINIYSDSFDDKDGIIASIDRYNNKVLDENKIIYTDYVGLIMESVTSIVNTISYILIAFVAISLIVSSIMIGIITYISVLERTKEIGILRALGASKKNITQVFNSETFIIGFISGIMGIVFSALLLIPTNMLVKMVIEEEIKARLPILGSLMLVVLSIFLTMIGGFIPSKKAAKKDPVLALKSE